MTESAGTMQDVVVVGGGAAGLGAALTLARARRRVTVVDGGQPRNAPADGVHALLGLDGVSPAELLRRGRDEVTGYGGEIVAGQVVDAVAVADGFAVTLADGVTIRARRLVIATGLLDELPEIPGVAELWGKQVIHCPYCHGWEVRDRAIGVLGTGPMSVHQALLFRQWSDDVRLFARDLAISADERLKLDALGIAVIEGDVVRLEVESDELRGVRLEDGRVVPVEAVVVASRMVARIEPFAGLGIEPTEHPMGSYVTADPTGRTTVPGVWVAGNATDLSAQVGAAAADGARVAAQVNADLIFADADRAVARMVGAAN
ncbi:NAD(P)/FAD-dependent oxidoreductase [Georgenia sunbinii]|uniref:NAD(P)/FAD-dependent oxidoreductase n=1 Tax=Georgenia sunbinii TaxID=3117728 RepID=UPI002F263481